MKNILKIIKIGVVSLIIFFISLFIALQLAFRLPYVENWPHTGPCYGCFFMFVSIVLIARWRHKMATPENWSINRFALNGVVLAVLLSGFLSITLRWLTENEISYAFNEGVIVEKYVSSNHGHLSLKINSPETGLIQLEGFDRLLWSTLNTGDRVSKKFGTIEVTLLESRTHIIE